MKHTRQATRSSALKLALLSRGPHLYSTRRLVEAGHAEGHSVRIIDTLACELIVARSAPQILYHGAELRRPHVVLPRIGASITSYGLAVVNQFEMMQVPVVNGSVPIARARDKLRALQMLAGLGLDVPRTVITRRAAQLQSCVDAVGGFPVILKVLQGTQGVGVMIATTHAEAASVLDAMWELGQDIIVQEFIKESRGKDIRALVVGDAVVAAMSRTAKRGEFRSNIHRGAVGKAVKLSRSYARAAVEAAQAMGLQIAGVDILLARHGPKIMEINSSPGIEGLEAATGVDVAKQIMVHVAKSAATAHATSGPR